MAGTSKKIRFKTKPPGQMALEGMELAETPARPVKPPDDAFTAFWNAYPRKVDRYQTRMVWDKLMKEKDVKMEEIFAGLRAQLPILAKNGPFTPHPCTWLRRRRWQDRVTDISPQQPTQAERLYAAALELFGEGKVRPRRIRLKRWPSCPCCRASRSTRTHG
jgi:hypothetical protein